MKVKPKKLKVSGSPAPLAAVRRVATELNQLKANSCSHAHYIQKAAGVGLVLKPDDEVVCIAHDDHVGRGLVRSPALAR